MERLSRSENCHSDLKVSKNWQKLTGIVNCSGGKKQKLTKIDWKH
jgi:hypothetical protein